MHPLSPLDLSPAPYNPRTLSPEAAAGLTRSLQEFGDIAGISWNARTKRLVTGHQRLAQLRQLHGDRLRIEIRPGEEDERAKLVAPDGQAWAVRIVDWPEEREKAANIAANNPLIGGPCLRGGGPPPYLSRIPPSDSSTLKLSEWNSASSAA